MKGLFLLLFLGFTSCGMYYLSETNSLDSNKDKSKPKGPGCYELCQIPDRVRDNIIATIEYTGTDFENANVALEEFVTEEPYAEWVKKKANKNCLSSNPEDCLVWCFIEHEAKYEEYYTVIDTSLTDEYKVVERNNKTFIKGAELEWIQVLCEDDFSDEMIKDIQFALSDKGYNLGSESINVVIKSITKNALKDYQIKHDLPICTFNFRTLRHLGVEIEVDY